MKEEKDKSLVHEWLFSLAVTIAGCAIFFIFFTNYYLELQRQITLTQVRGEMLEARLAVLESNLFWEQTQNNRAAQAVKKSVAKPDDKPASNDDRKTITLEPDKSP